MSKEARLNMRIDRDLLEQVKEVAKRRGVTITHLIDQHLRALIDQENRPRSEEELGVEQA